MSPYNVCCDLKNDLVMSAIVNGLQIDSFQVTVKSLDNQILYDSGSSVTIPNSNSGITYSGTWTTATNQTIDDTNPLIQYYGNGWLQNSDPHYYNGTDHHSNLANDYAQYTFLGTGINTYFTFGIDKGIFEVFIDGLSEGTIDTYIAGTSINGNNFRTLAYSITNLAYGSHTIKFLVLGTKNSSSADSRIDLDYLQVLNTNGSKNCSNGGSYLQYTFLANGIDIYMDKTPDSGTIQISIDGIDQGIIDLYSPTYDLNVLAFTNTNLALSNHTIKITLTGSKSSQSSNSFCYFDSLKTSNKTALPTMLYDKQLFSFTLPANTITQKGAIKWQLTLWNNNNNGENVSSGEMIFTSMSTPTSVLNAPTTITNKSFTFTSTYSQAENIPIKKYNYSLYAINYQITEGYFGQSVNGSVIDEGTFGSVFSGISVDEGTF